MKRDLPMLKQLASLRKARDLAEFTRIKARRAALKARIETLQNEGLVPPEANDLQSWSSWRQWSEAEQARLGREVDGLQPEFDAYRRKAAEGLGREEVLDHMKAVLRLKEKRKRSRS
jgi:hypothetical protein